MHGKYTTQGIVYSSPKWKSIADNIREISKENRNFIYALDSAVIQKVIPELEFEGYVFIFNKKKDNLFYYEVHPNRIGSRLSNDMKEKIEVIAKKRQKYSDAFLENFTQALKSNNSDEIVHYRNHDDFSNATLDILLLGWYYLNLPQQNKFILYKRPLALNEWKSKIISEIENSTHGITFVSKFEDEEFQKEFEQMLNAEKLEFSFSHGMYKITKKNKNDVLYGVIHGDHLLFSQENPEARDIIEKEEQQKNILKIIDKYFENADRQTLILYALELLESERENFRKSLEERNLTYQIKGKDIYVVRKNSHLRWYVDTIISNFLSAVHSKNSQEGTMEYPPIKEEDEVELYNMCFEHGIEITRNPKCYDELLFKKSTRSIIPDSDVRKFTENLKKSESSINFEHSRKARSIYNEIMSLIKKEGSLEYKIAKNLNLTQEVIQLLQEKDLDVKVVMESSNYQSIAVSVKKESSEEKPPLIFDNLKLSKINNEILSQLNRISSTLIQLPHGEKLQVNLNSSLKESDAIAIAHRLASFLYDTDIYFSKTDGGDTYYTLEIWKELPKADPQPKNAVSTVTFEGEVNSKQNLLDLAPKVANALKDVLPETLPSAPIANYDYFDEKPMPIPLSPERFAKKLLDLKGVIGYVNEQIQISDSGPIIVEGIFTNSRSALDAKEAFSKQGWSVTCKQGNKNNEYILILDVPSVR